MREYLLEISIVDLYLRQRVGFGDDVIDLLFDGLRLGLDPISELDWYLEEGLEILDPYAFSKGVAEAGSE